MKRKRILLVVIVALVSTLTTWLILALNCPSVGIALTTNARNLHRLKNRTALPVESDFDRNVTLDALLQRGDDSTRWSTTRAARIQGEVLDVAYARPEATNCFNPCRRDIHITLAKYKGAPKTEQVILEVTPNFYDWAKSQGLDWSEAALQKQLAGRWCEFEGWLFLDAGHQKEAENTAPNRQGNWRGTAWEIHPITAIRVLR